MGLYLGVDPGLRGGLVALDDSGKVVYQRIMPVSLQGTRKYVDPSMLITALESLPQAPCIATVEMVGGFAGQGGSATFNFGYSTGTIMTVIKLRGWPVLRPAPQTWQGKLLGKIPARSNTKAVSCGKARERFPDLVLRPGRMTTDHDGLADAAWLAEFGRLKILKGE